MNYFQKQTNKQNCFKFSTLFHSSPGATNVVDFSETHWQSREQPKIKLVSCWTSAAPPRQGQRPHLAETAFINSRVKVWVTGNDTHHCMLEEYWEKIKLNEAES